MRNKTVGTVFYFVAVAFYIAAIIFFITENRSTGVTWVSLASTFMCLGAALKTEKKKDNEDTEPNEWKN